MKKSIEISACPKGCIAIVIDDLGNNGE